MNKVFFVVLFLSLAHLATAQGENHFNAGVGLDSWGIPIYGSYDWHFADDFNLGAGGILNLGSSSNDEFDGSSLGLGFFTQWYADRVAAIPSDFRCSSNEIGSLVAAPTNTRCPDLMNSVALKTLS